jgi:hypothetical protein
MNETQKKYSALAAELKALDETDKRAASKVKYAEYMFKVGTYGHTLDPVEKILDLTDEDRETAHVGLSGLAYTGYEGKSQSFCYVMLKSKEDYARTQTVLNKLEAVENLKDDKVKDKEKWLKVLLGEA